MPERPSLWGVGPSIVLGAGCYALLAFAVTRYLPEVFEIPWAYYPILATIGAVLLVIGVSLLVWAGQATVKIYRQDQLATTGPFGFVRHPIYAIWILFLLPGLALLSGSWLISLTPIVAYIIFRLRIPVEENYLDARFGQNYREYRDKVGAVLPISKTVARHLRSILLLPFTVTMVLPALLLMLSGLDPHDLWRKHPWISIFGPVVGGLVLLLGLGLVLATILLFVIVSDGTLAPWDPTKKLVFQGIYRYVRNPMITGVALILLGESIIFASSVILIWAVVFIITNLIYIPLIEEPGLHQRFGQEYADYQRIVPRWIPRFWPASIQREPHSQKTINQK